MSSKEQKALETLKRAGYCVVLRPAKQVKMKRKHIAKVNEILTAGDDAIVRAREGDVSVLSSRTYKVKCAVAAKMRAARKAKKEQQPKA